MKYFGGCDVGSTYTKAVILDENGKMVTNSWFHLGDNSNWYYFGKNGKAYRGWHKINNKWYYFCETEHYYPYMYRNSIYTIDGEKYYFNSNGVMTTGWSQFKGRWLYAESKGHLYTNTWKKINKKWYYFDYNGYMATGYYNIDGHLYHFSDDGVCLNPNAYKN